MNKQKTVPLGIKVLIGYFIFCAVGWLIGQGGAVISYDTVAEWGLQEPTEGLDPVLIEVSRGIGLGDVIIQVPLFALAAIGLWRLSSWGAVVSWLALGTHLYWTTIAWAKQYIQIQAGLECQPFDLATHGMLAFFFLSAVWASWYLYKNRMLFDWDR